MEQAQTSFYTDLNGMNAFIKGVTYNNIRQLSDITGRFNGTTKVVNIGMNKFEKIDPVQIAVTDKHVSFKDRTSTPDVLKRSLFPAIPDYMDEAEFFIKRYNFYTSSNQQLEMTQIFKIDDYEGARVPFVQNFYGVNVRKHGYNKKELYDLLHDHTRPVQLDIEHNKDVVPLFKTYLDDGNIVVPKPKISIVVPDIVAVPKPEIIVEPLMDEPEHTSVMPDVVRSLQEAKGKSLRGHYREQLRRKIQKDDKNTARGKKTIGPYHLFKTIPPYPEDMVVPVQSSKNLWNGRYMNRTKIVCAAICHASRGVPFSPAELSETIKGYRISMLMQCVYQMVHEGFLKYITVEGTAAKYLALKAVPSTLSEKDYYDVIKDFKGIPQINRISYESKPLMSEMIQELKDVQKPVAPLVNRSYSIVPANDVRMLMYSRKDYSEFAPGVDKNFLYHFNSAHLPATGRIAQMSIGQPADNLVINKIDLVTGHRQLPSVYIMSRPQQNEQALVPGTWSDTDVISANEKMNSQLQAVLDKQVKEKMQCTVVTAGKDAVNILRDQHDLETNYPDVRVTSDSGKFQCQLGDINVPGYGRVTSLNFDNNECAIHLVQFDSILQPIPPQVIFMQTQTLNEKSQRSYNYIKSLVTADSTQEFGINSLAMGVLSYQSQKATLLKLEEKQHDLLQKIANTPVARPF